MSQDYNFLIDTLRASRRQLLGVVGTLTATPLARYLKSYSSIEAASGSSIDEVAEKSLPTIKLLCADYDGGELTENLNVPLRRLFNEKSNPTLYYDPETWSSAEKIAIEFQHDPYPQRDVEKQPTKVITKDLDDSKTSIDLSDFNLGTYYITYSLKNGNGAKLHTKTEKIEIGSTDEILEGSY